MTKKVRLWPYNLRDMDLDCPYRIYDLINGSFIEVLSSFTILESRLLERGFKNIKYYFLNYMGMQEDFIIDADYEFTTTDGKIDNPNNYEIVE